MSEFGDLVQTKCDAFADRVVKSNDYLLNFFDYQNKSCYFIDPGINNNPQLMALADKMHAVKIEKSITDFDARLIKW